MPVFAGGCHTWVPKQTVEPATYIQQEAPGDVIVHVAEGGGFPRYWVRDPAISGDSLQGSFMLRDRGQWRPVDLPGIPLTAVQPRPFEVRQFDTSMTLLVVSGAMAVVTTVLLAIVLATTSETP